MRTSPTERWLADMELVVCYDINTETKAGERRLRKVAKVCEGYGQRVQMSVFECIVDQAGYHLLTAALTEAIEGSFDSVLIYRLREPYGAFVRRLGRVPLLDQRAPLIL